MKVDEIYSSYHLDDAGRLRRESGLGAASISNITSTKSPESSNSVSIGLFTAPIPWPLYSTILGLRLNTEPGCSWGITQTGFGPGRIFRAWHDRYPKSIPHLHSTIIKPCIEEIALQENDRVIIAPRLKVRLLDCTLDYIRNVLNPGILPAIYAEDAPFTWDYLSVFTISPNKWRKGRAQMGKDGKPAVPREVDEWEETPEGSTGESGEFAGETEGFWKRIGFARNPTFIDCCIMGYCPDVSGNAWQWWEMGMNACLPQRGISLEIQVVQFINPSGVYSTRKDHLKMEFGLWLAQWWVNWMALQLEGVDVEQTAVTALGVHQKSNA
ncbi:hypothetical protein DFH08DRAFT_803330 [Mycena albidolilacea]|uniref:Uncharacterized protein n=1 Tax=Mycena albidolilacea TaxID=1033008 RepID=A0AAD7ADY0_9AGAR|nr:hypothetical protein DFH08DRAFT_803330 [Mycena albidolilacea]